MAISCVRRLAGRVLLPSVGRAEKLKFAPRPVNRGLELGKTGRLYCRASGSTPPTVRWVKQRADGQLVLDWPPHVTDENGTLVFRPVKEADGGRYSCVATNPQGFINATINVTIIGERGGDA